MRLIDSDKAINDIDAMEIPEQTKNLFKNILSKNSKKTPLDIDCE